MTRIHRWAALLALGGVAVILPLEAQQTPGRPGAGSQTAQPAEVEPEEPAIVLPEVILEIEDISVEQVEAGLPQDEELLPPEREVPLPEAGELVIEELQMAAGDLEGAAGVLPEREGALAAEGVLGAGSMNHFYSSISLFRTGAEPRFQLSFLHEMLDGFSGEAPGVGFSRREDSLDGSIRFQLGTVTLGFEGTVADTERGLQGLSDFATEIERTAELRSEASVAVSDLWTLGAGVDAHSAGLLLTGGTDSSGRTEYAIQPRLFAEIRTDNAWFGLTGRYGYRAMPEEPSHRLQRAGVAAHLGFNLPQGFRLEGEGGWYYAENVGHLLPFSLAISGSPVEMFSFSLRGGYRVQQLDVLDILQAYDFTDLPDAELEDNRGWFGELSANVSLSSNFFINGEAQLYFDSAMPDPGDPADPEALNLATGLFPFHQREATRLTTAVSVRWNPGSTFSMGAGWELDWLDRPTLVSPLRIRLQSEGLGRDGLWGWQASALLYDFEGLQMPMFDVSGFYRLSDTIRMILEVNDIFQPLQNEPRRIDSPYVDSGIRGTVKVQITL